MTIITIKFVNEGIQFTPAMEEAVKAEVRKLEKYGVTSLRIRADRQPHHQFIVSAVCVSDRAEGFAAKAEADDFYAAVPAVVEKLRRQLRAEKTKVLSRRDKTKGRKENLEETRVEKAHDDAVSTITQVVLGSCVKIVNLYFPECTPVIINNLDHIDEARNDLADILTTLDSAVADQMRDMFGHSESDDPDEYDMALSEVISEPYFRLLIDSACIDMILDYFSAVARGEVEVA